MEIDRNSWHAKVYLWCLRIWAKFKYGRGHTDSEYYYCFTEKTNLCLYIRAIIVWMPLVVLLHLFLLAYAIGILSIPFFTFGWGYVKFLATAAVTLAVLAVVGIFLAKKLITLEEESREERDARFKAKRQRREEKERRKVKKSPSFTQVILEWARAKKAKICPIIDLVDFAEKGGG